MAMKHCSKCFEVLPANPNYFSRDKNRKDGLYVHCKQCVRVVKKKYYEENKLKVNESNKRYHQKNRRKMNIASKNYYRRNKNRLNELNKIWRKNNKFKMTSYRKKWIESNPEMNAESIRIGKLKRLARMSNLKNDFNINKWQECLMHFNHQCAYCGSTESLEQEHVIPVSRGGHYTPDNIIPACRSCNASKNNKIMQDWFTQHENYSVERMANILKYVQKNKTEVNI